MVLVTNVCFGVNVWNEAVFVTGAPEGAVPDAVTV